MKPFKCQNSSSKKHFNPAVIQLQTSKILAAQEFSHTFPMVGNTCTDKLAAVAIVQLPMSKVICTYLSLQGLR